MRKIMAAALLTLPLGLGCAHVGGVCDCAPIPGDSTGGFNPHVQYHTVCPGCNAPAPVVASTNSTTTPVSTNGGSFEAIASPKSMPKSKN
jgi:hypothetical protein